MRKTLPLYVVLWLVHACFLCRLIDHHIISQMEISSNTKTPSSSRRGHPFSGIWYWLGRKGSNLRMTESKSVALPLGDSPILGRPMGIEPTSARATIWCVNHFATAAIKDGVPGGIRTPDRPLRRRLLYPTELLRHRLERVMGIEPTRPAWKAGVLPLNYTRMMKMIHLRCNES